MNNYLFIDGSNLYAGQYELLLIHQNLNLLPKEKKVIEEAQVDKELKAGKGIKVGSKKEMLEALDLSDDHDPTLKKP